MAQIDAAAAGELQPEDNAAQHPLRLVARTLQGELKWQDIRTGRWFEKTVRASLRHFEAEPSPRETVPALIRRASLETAAVAGGAAVVTTGAALFTAETGALGVVGALPVASVAIGLEALARVLIDVRLMSQLARTCGITLREEDAPEVTRLLALVSKTEPHEEDLRANGGFAGGVVGHLLSVEVEHLGGDLGLRLLGEGVLKNVVPFIGMMTSPYVNWRRTRRLGTALLGFLRYRQALTAAFAEATRQAPECEPLLIEGAWFLFRADGRLSPEEAATLVHLLHRAGPGIRDRLAGRFTGDESLWLENLRSGVPEQARDAFLHALHVAAAVGLWAPRSVRKVLRQAAHVLGRDLDKRRLDDLLEHLRAQEVASSRAVSRAVAPFLRAAEGSSMGAPA